MDIGPGFIDYAKQKAESLGVSTKLDFIIGDICDICLGEELFDVIVCAEVLEHLLEPAKAIEEFERVLKPGGTLIITVPNPLRVSFSLHGMINVLRALVSVAFRRLLGNRAFTTDFPLAASREYDIKPTIYKHTEFAPFEFNNMLPAKLQILRSWSIVYSFCRIIKKEGSNYRFSKLAEKAALLNMMGMYSLLLAKKLTLRSSS
jgi:ubiquinone/menaquinone biosynthesis C-methylase UbiE